ncbi:MAG: hypothetical protein SchgKO_11030 [Schleiferiaceae bacterium]
MSNAWIKYFLILLIFTSQTPLYMQPRRFETKKDNFMAFVIFGPSVILTLIMLDNRWDLLPGIELPVFDMPVSLPAFFWLFSLSAWFRTYYEIYDGKLIARFSFLKRTIPLSQIKSIGEANAGQRIYGLSTDVVSISYGKRRHINVSPEEKEEFVRMIKEGMDPGEN